MNSPAAEPQGPIRTPLPYPLPVRRGEGEATPRSLSALIQRQWGDGLGPWVLGVDLALAWEQLLNTHCRNECRRRRYFMQDVQQGQ